MNFALIGASGFVAPRHMRAIRDSGNNLLAAYDPNDSVGIIDSYFPEADFFTEYERFDRHLEKLKRQGVCLDFVSVCSPNYLHDAHIRFGLRLGANVICEKPLVLNPWNVEALKTMEEEHKKRVFTILQLRLHPAIKALKQRIDESPEDTVHDVELTYITSRGKWYYTSWKGDLQKSGGIATNIGIHFFDMLQWIFGPVRENLIHVHTHDRAGGLLILQRARVRWFLSINAGMLPEEVSMKGGKTFRSMTVDKNTVEFSEGFTDLHSLSYQEILSGAGFGLEDATPAIQIVHQIRNTPPGPSGAYFHPLAQLPPSPHPFSNHLSAEI
jgi:UDP-N-acetyl-2-amino-2-deoxyglucuronate dehydrogenase